MAAGVTFWWEDWGIKTDLISVEMGGVEVEDARLFCLQYRIVWLKGLLVLIQRPWLFGVHISPQPMGDD